MHRRDDLVDNFSKHQDEVEKILSEGVKKIGLNGR
jgi:homogentisate 1,2-dioxygenase